jgi:hypothetical protein
MTSKVGNETKADMAGAGMTNASGGSVVGNTSLGSARDHLYREHPHHYDDHGPHHGTSSHRVMSPLGGLRPAGHK